MFHRSPLVGLTLLAPLAAKCCSQSVSLLQTLTDPIPRGVHVGPTRIPCVVHQTWQTHQLSDQQKRCVNTWKSKNPECEHRLWNDTEIAALCQEKSPGLIWPIWDGLSPVQRADVFRYLVLWDQGGYYADIDVRCHRPVADFPVPKDVNMIVGYEAGRRLEEAVREKVDFSRVEQFENWFLASAPGNPVLLRTLEIIRQKFLWKVQKTIDFTGPGTLSDAVHEFLANSSEEHGIPAEISRRTGQYAGKLSFPSESTYQFGEWKAFLFASGRVSTGGYASGDDPAENVLEHMFSGTWKRGAAVIGSTHLMLVSK
ncbi:unnamed protein product [Cladocopium goreaui]|uniref:ABC transporter G family member 24 n=1 Tax=Cladocopium goreaui TaxID=2562237 RepID=A0A9P1CPB4_9DINO|nr:unnamed protein product [Cladocopium goreaui]|mmetsp:Transcript_29576/g.63965  ORF Transcript_29576/g.63965 Transcript_29576/m.63965 type:complete len:313 (+) Transcript_29576:41-979(+)